ncbi:MAG: fucose isomerase [Firmicutes bacterium]|nr:fucose isomerase [Bacillota bacterium]
MYSSNIPSVKLGIISVSRDCFVISLSEGRRHAVAEAYRSRYGEIYDCPVTVESERDMASAVADVKAAGCNALIVFLGNFGPETPETQIAKYFDGPVMYCAAAEENTGVLTSERGDAYCGMLNCSYNLALRGQRAYIPENPVGTAENIAEEIHDFVPVARAVIGLSKLKIITFGPRPADFFACNAPIKPLYDVGVEIEENSELDLLVSYRGHEGDERIPAIIEEMKGELEVPDKMKGILPRLAQFECTLIDWAENHKGSREFVAFADKCWPAFQTEFKFCPCYVNSRLTSRGIPVACETDVYGALSEYIGWCVSENPVTLLDINNTVPRDMYEKHIKGYRQNETFMGFHCGNTSACLIKNPTMKYQLIMKRSLEPDGEPDITRGTIEGTIKDGDITFFRLQSTADASLKAYIAHGEVLPVEPCSFGGIGVFAIPEMGRFYRHVLIEKHFPHHGAVAFGHCGKYLFEVFKYLGIEDISYSRPANVLYPTENPFS